jgi:hypothetical protein
VVVGRDIGWMPDVLAAGRFYGRGMRPILPLPGLTDRRAAGPSRGARQIIIDVRAGRHGACNVDPTAQRGRVDPSARQAETAPS